MTASLPSTCGDAPLHRLGMGLSALCLIHCIALPWLLTILPAAILSTLPDALPDSEWLHAGLMPRGEGVLRNGRRLPDCFDSYRIIA